MIKQFHGRDGRISLDVIASTLTPFHAGLSEGQLRAIQDYLYSLLEWNRSMNLTAIDDPMEILSRHFGESLFAASLLKIGESRLADVGTGPGFPGLPLRIVCPEMKLSLFESNSRKCAFLTEIVRRLQFSGVNIRKQRYEEFRSDDARFDFVCSRALGDFSAFLPWARSVLNPGGSVILWLGTDESIRLGRRSEFNWNPPVPIPESRRRVILIGSTPADHECST
jgi:16S rRNA (guanine527-N7)-methyltransferase